MVGPLKRFRRDPNRKGRGAGLYYHRGKGYYSKWGAKLDRKRGGKVGAGRYRQTHDAAGVRTARLGKKRHSRRKRKRK